MSNQLQPEEKSSGQNALLCWVTAPILGLVWRDSEDDYLKAHARASMYFGIANFGLWLGLSLLELAYNQVVLVLLSTGLYGFYGIASLLTSVWGAVWMLYWVFTVLPRIIGAFEAYSGNTWEVPGVSRIVRPLLPASLK